MAEAIDNDGGNADPWYKEFGLNSDDDVKNAFISQKKQTEDLTKYKSEAKEAAAMKQELEALRAEKQKTIDAEKTELEKAQARIAALESDLTEKDKAVTQAQRNTTFERELSKRLAGMDDKQRKLKRMLYEAAVKTSDGFDDEETLAEILNPVDELLKDDDDEPHGKTVIQQPGSAQQAANKSQKMKDFSKMTHGELMKAAKNRSK